MRLPRLIDDPHSPPPELALDHEPGDRGGLFRRRKPLGLAFLARRRISGQPLQNLLAGGAASTWASIAAKREPLDGSRASRLSVSGEGHGDMGHPGGRLKVQSISGPSDFWLMHPRFGQEPLPLFAEHPADTLLGGERGVVGDARGF